MSMETALRSRLLASEALAAIVGTKVDWMVRPQRDALPGVTLQIVTDERTQNFSGFDGMQPGYVQIDPWSATYAEAVAMKEAIIAAVTPAGLFFGVRFTRGFVTVRDLGEQTDTIFVFRPSIDLTFFYSLTA